MIKLIWAMDKNNLIGKENKIPWHYKKDLQYFKNHTQNQDVLMGKNTYLSLKTYYKDRPLPFKKIYVASNTLNDNNEYVLVKDLTNFLQNYPKEKDLFVCGGSMIYEKALEYADYLYVTKINEEYDGDAYFPYYDENNYNLIKQNNIDVLSFCVYERKKK